MRKIAVISISNNPDYYNLVPIVAYSWNKIGYKTVVLHIGVPDEVIDKLIPASSKAIFVKLMPLEGVLDATLAQFSRLFAHEHDMFTPEDVLVLGDADMVMAKKIFIDSPEMFSYGFDLTGRSEIPMCYVSGDVSHWREMMGMLIVPVAARSTDWASYWSSDQQLLTQRAREYGFDKITFVDRGNNNKHGLPTGRWDRHDWANIPADIIDVHMKRNDWDAQFEVFKRLWPEDDMGWLLKYKAQATGAWMPIELDEETLKSIDDANVIASAPCTLR